MISTAPGEFAAQVDWLASNDVAVVGVDDLISREDDGDAVALTFDDAYTNFETAAWPLLHENGFPVTLFVATAHVGGSNQWDTLPSPTAQSIPILGWNALRSLAERGVTLGAHSRTHADLRLLSEAQVTDEIEGSVHDIMRETGMKPSGFAYPYGRLDERVSRIAREHCEWACTTELRALSGNENRHELPRLDSYFLRGAGSLSAFGSRSFASYMSLRRTIRRVRNR